MHMVYEEGNVISKLPSLQIHMALRGVGIVTYPN